MIRILCTGDSHTWGQGTEGLEKEFDPAWVGGELRLTGFEAGSYVNRLRRMVNAATGSSAREWTARDISRMTNIGFEAPCALLDGEIELSFEGELVRMEFGMAQEASAAEILIDGGFSGEWDLQSERTVNAWKLATLHPGKGRHVLTVRAKKGLVRLFRIEVYEGACAVINSGIGSCPAERLRTDFWKDYVEAVQPDIVLMEAHTINDWLTGETPEEHCRILRRLMADVRQMGAEPVLMTVAPIGGDQILPGLAAEYDRFVEAGRRAARLESVRLCDANALMKIMISGMNERQTSDYLLADNWHPNDRGHAVYAQLLYEALASEKWFMEMEEKSDENR